MNKKTIILLALIAITSLTFAQYSCDWNTFSNGSSSSLHSTSYKAFTTAGQPAIGSLNSTDFLAYIGFWYPGFVTGIQENKGDELVNITPIVTKLYLAKPNPFGLQTVIRYSLSAQSKVALLVHDITGRLVTTLVDENKPAGVYTLNWQGKDAQNRKLSAGVYFYTLKTENYTKTNKLVITD
jgi:hypothetical protein